MFFYLYFDIHEFPYTLINLILPQISFQQVKGNLKESRFNSVVKIGTPSFLKKIKGKVFNLCQGGSGNNYFHFIFDIIPKIHLLIYKKKLKEVISKIWLLTLIILKIYLKIGSNHRMKLIKIKN